MAAPRLSSSGFRTGRGGLPIAECALALSVIVGLAFVTVRIMSMDAPASSAQTDALAPPPAPNASANKAQPQPHVAMMSSAIGNALAVPPISKHSGASAIR